MLGWQNKTYTQHIISFHSSGKVKHSYRHNYMGYNQEQSPFIYPTRALCFVYKRASFPSIKSLHYGKIINTAAIGVGKFL